MLASPQNLHFLTVNRQRTKHKPTAKETRSSTSHVQQEARVATTPSNSDQAGPEQGRTRKSEGKHGRKAQTLTASSEERS